MPPWLLYWLQRSQRGPTISLRETQQLSCQDLGLPFCGGLPNCGPSWIDCTSWWVSVGLHLPYTPSMSQPLGWPLDVEMARHPVSTLFAVSLLAGLQMTPPSLYHLKTLGCPSSSTGSFIMTQLPAVVSRLFLTLECCPWL